MANLSERWEKESAASQPVFAFWRRIFAFTIDLLFLELISVLLALALFPLWVTLNDWGRLIGFAIAILYFGILNSTYGQGQTLGKRLTQVKVVDRNGNLLGLGRSLLRAIVLSLITLPFVSRDLAGLIYEKILIHWFISSPILFITQVILAGLQALDLYFFLFNRRTRQTIHDFVARSVVIKVGSSFPQLPRVWKWHFVIALFLSGILVAVDPPPFQGFYNNEAEFPELAPAYRSLRSTDRFDVVHVIPHTLVFNDVPSQTLEVILALKQKSGFSEQTVSEVIDVINQTGAGEGFNTVLVRLSYGFNLGLVTARQQGKYWYCPGQNSWTLQEKQEQPLTVKTPNLIRFEIDQAGHFSAFSIGASETEQDEFDRFDELHHICPATNTVP